MPSAIEGCLEACRRCETLVEMLSPADYARIGPHVRHCIDHFECLLLGLDTGVVDYDARGRARTLEVDPRAMRAALASLVRRLGALGAARVPASVRVRQSAAPGTPPIEVDSNLERELVFLSGHTIHHIAIVVRILEGHGVRLPSEIDVAYSTAAFLDGAQAARGHA